MAHTSRTRCSATVRPSSSGRRTPWPWWTSCGSRPRSSRGTRAWPRSHASCIYDRRGTGLSSRNVAPGSLEVQVQDTLAVLDAEGIEQAVFGGFLESGATNVLLAATRPERVRALVWVSPQPPLGSGRWVPVGRRRRLPGQGAGARGTVGTLGWAREYVALNADVLGGAWSSESYIRFLARASRRTCTPDVAKELARIGSRRTSATCSPPCRRRC